MSAPVPTPPVSTPSPLRAMPTKTLPLPPRRHWVRGMLSWLALVLCLLWGFSGAQVNVSDLVKGVPQMKDVLSRMLPPDTSELTDPKVYGKPDELTITQLIAPLPLSKDKQDAKTYWWNSTFPQTLLGGTIQTIQMALAGSIIALIFAFPLSFLAARNTSPHPIFYHAVKQTANFARTIPDFAIGLILIAGIGLGPFAGTLALAFNTSAVLVKLFSESLENIDEGVVEALKATGASYSQVLGYAVVPQVMPSFISLFLYRFETCIRSAAVLGLIGAGGIGQLMTTNFRMFEYAKGAMSVAVLIVLVMAVDSLSAQLRKLVT